MSSSVRNHIETWKFSQILNQSATRTTLLSLITKRKLKEIYLGNLKNRRSNKRLKSLKRLLKSKTGKIDLEAQPLKQICSKELCNLL